MVLLARQHLQLMIKVRNKTGCSALLCCAVSGHVFFFLNVGYDVFLGNLRGLVSREHIDKSISSYK